MLDDTFLDEGLGVNFETATLEMKKENENCPNINGIKQNEEAAIPSSMQVSNIPFKIDVQSYFSDREEVIERALKDCQMELLQNSEEKPIGTWLLTEISLWDTEKERLVLLTKDSLFSVKYDLISLKIIEYNKVSLMDVDTIIAGDLIYPSKSLLPNRNMFGLRIMWNKEKPLPLDKKWNPFAKNIPWLTFTSHPLHWHKGSKIYDVKDLHVALQSLIPEHSSKMNRPIIVENYVGIGSLIHNRNSLGFFKIRGKVSF